MKLVLRIFGYALLFVIGEAFLFYGVYCTLGSPWQEVDADTRGAITVVHGTGEIIEGLEVEDPTPLPSFEEVATNDPQDCDEDEDEIICTYEHCNVCGYDKICEGVCCCGVPDWDYCPVCQAYNPDCDILANEPEEVEPVEDTEAIEEVEEVEEELEEVESEE